MQSLTTFLFIAPLLNGLLLAHPTSYPKLPARKSKVLKSRLFDTSDLYRNWPTYAELPLDPSHPTKSAWGVWGADDVHGALNHITSETIRAAASEIQVGKGINLNLDLSFFPTPLNTGRKPTVHEFKSQPGYMDDVININTQAGTQYDGLRHFPYSTDGNTSTYQYYNDLITYDEIAGTSKTPTLGIQQAAQKGIAGRGVLLDFARYAEAHNITYDPFTNTTISAAQLSLVANFQNLSDPITRPGDILLIRTGWTLKYNSLSEIEKGGLPWEEDGTGNIGVETSDATAEWIWEKKLALVGGDAPAFERLPFTGEIDGVSEGISLHKVFIAGWGQSIMEYLDLEELSETLHQLGRSTFFLTVQNLNIEGGVASPPNAMAIV